MKSLDHELEIINKEGKSYIFKHCLYFQYIPSTDSWKIELSDFIDFPCTIFIKNSLLSSIGWYGKL